MAELAPDAEARLAAYIQQMYATWLPAVQSAALGAYSRFGMSPDVSAVSLTTGMWRDQIRQLQSEQLQPIAAQAYAEEDPEGQFSVGDALLVAAAAGTTFFLMAQIAELQNLLASAISLSPDVPAAVRAVREVLDPASRHWMLKSRQVAQTEGDRWVQAATLSAAHSASRRDGIPRIKTWVSRDDDRVRASHIVADGQRRPLSVPFIVGGFPMQYPKDPIAPPQEVVNCRCGMKITKEGSRG